MNGMESELPPFFVNQELDHLNRSKAGRRAGWLAAFVLSCLVAPAIGGAEADVRRDAAVVADHDEIHVPLAVYQDAQRASRSVTPRSHLRVTFPASAHYAFGTIALALLMLNSREPGFRKVSRLSLPTQVFQINEPIFFGFPIVLNPSFMVPYILNALLLTTGSYLLMHWDIIRKPFVNIPWTTPPVIGHYLATGGDWKAAVWGVLSIILAMLVYYPFAKAAESQRLKAHQ